MRFRECGGFREVNEVRELREGEHVRDALENAQLEVALIIAKEWVASMGEEKAWLYGKEHGPELVTRWVRIHIEFRDWKWRSGWFVGLCGKWKT